MSFKCKQKATLTPLLVQKFTFLEKILDFLGVLVYNRYMKNNVI